MINMDITYINQINLTEKGTEKNREFIVSLYDNEELEEVSRWFSKLDCSISIRRESDRDMTMDEFVKGIGPNSFIILQLASPNPFDIKYCASYISKSIRKSAWVTCPYNDNNLDVILGLYGKSFGCRIQDEPSHEGLLAYYKNRVQLGH